MSSSRPNAAHCTLLPLVASAVCTLDTVAVTLSLLASCTQIPSCRRTKQRFTSLRGPSGLHTHSRMAHVRLGSAGRSSTSEGLRWTSTRWGDASCTTVMRRARSQPAPWMLKAASTPLQALTFQILHALSRSRQTSWKRQSAVGRACCLQRRTEPSGRTSRLRTRGSCSQGRSLTYTAVPPTARAAAWRPATLCLDQNMSQSGWTISPRKRELYVTLAMCVVQLPVCLGQKSSLARATAVSE
mmetsp:Transcript_33874/g.68626  ORF Transcript_33874/g.68626 Transcript_33874/m.68626 type:complete len:242 (-) Transcript_33874:168-893(-)